MSRELILVRHGQTVHNVAGIAQGWNDSDLSDLGRTQVQRLAERVALLRPTALYSSSLGRALSTAEAIARKTGLTVVPLDDLREMSYGGWEGKSFLDVRREDEEIYQRWIVDAECACPEGESHADVRRRMERAFAAIAESKDAERAVVVTHGTAIRIAVTALLDLPTMTSRHFAQDNASLNRFLWRQDRWVLKVWNDTTHCRDER
ncbi:MAG TPA: histidine phosphatase family protein [Thermoanaerobaculia bacterium]|nr:histidine phosphatase family protein [Thermoanaerobaculia bacterium]